MMNSLCYRLTLGCAFALAGLFVGLSALVWLAVVDGKPYFDWDLDVSRAVQSVEGPGITTLMRVVSWSGDEVVYSTIVVTAAVVVLLIFGRRREALVLVALVLIGQALKIGIKNLVGRPRPSANLVSVLISAHEANSFPSGHTVHYTVTYGFLCFLAFTLVKPAYVRWPLVILLGGLVVLVGPARIYLGAHWVSDIIGGHLLGGAILAGGIVACWRWNSPGRLS